MTDKFEKDMSAAGKGGEPWDGMTAQDVGNAMLDQLAQAADLPYEQFAALMFGPPAVRPPEAKEAALRTYIDEHIYKPMAKALASKHASSQRWGKVWRAAFQLVERWEDGDRQPVYCYGGVIECVPASYLKRIGATVTRKTDDLVLVTFSDEHPANAAHHMAEHVSAILRDSILEGEFIWIGNDVTGECERIDIDLTDILRENGIETIIVRKERNYAAELDAIEIEREPRSAPAYLQHDPTKNTKRRRRQPRGARYARKGFRA